MDSKFCYQHGDVKLFAIDVIPAGMQLATRPVLAIGEVTGHAHRLSDPAQAEVFTDPTAARVGPADVGVRYLRVLPGGVDLLHEEHKPIHLDEGLYAIDFVYEFDYFSEEVKRVTD